MPPPRTEGWSLLCFQDSKGGWQHPHEFHRTTNNKSAYIELACFRWRQEQRVKNLEASSKAAARCARESIVIRELLEPTPFLLSQVCLR